MFKHILVAIDRSEYSQQALPTAIEMARRFESDVFVLHVSEHDRGRAVAYSLESPADATRMVASAVNQVKDAGISAKGKLVDKAAGHVAVAIAETAEGNDIDLIVIGTRGLSGVQGLLLGSVTHKVMQLAKVPVLAVRKPAAKGIPALAGAVGPEAGRP